MTSPLSRRRKVALGSLLATSLVAAGAAGTAVAGGYDLSRPGGATRLHGDQTSAVRGAIDGSHARNVILLIGDGMGDSEITSARNYEYGADGRLPGIDALPLTGQYTTFSLNKDGKPDYVTDSAASGTGWATGTKTYDGAISVDIRGKARTHPAGAGQGQAACAPATSPPPRSRTPPPPSRSPT